MFCPGRGGPNPIILAAVCHHLVLDLVVEAERDHVFQAPGAELVVVDKKCMSMSKLLVKKGTKVLDRLSAMSSRQSGNVWKFGYHQSGL